MLKNETQSTAEMTAWKKPVPLRADKKSMRDFPVDALPPILREMAKSISRTTSTDVAMSATAILSAVSYCFSGVYRMQGKPDHTEPLTLYSLILAEPSELKSPVVHFVKQPFQDFENEWNESHKTEIFACQEKKKALEKQVENMQKNDGEPQDIALLRTELDNMQDMDFRRIAIDDITPESLVRLLNVNSSLLMISDEAGMFGNFGGRYTGGIANVDLLLKCWNGERFTCDRVINGTVKLERPYLSVCLAGQPYILENLMSNPAFSMSGLVARFVYCFPKTNIGMRKYETEPINPKVRSSYENLVKFLLRRKLSRIGDSETNLHFDNTARENFAEYFDRVIEPSQTGDFAECRDWGGKYHGLILRIAGILHCVSCLSHGKNPADEPVTLDSLCPAIDLADYFKEQAIYAYGLRGIDDNIVKAELVLNKIKSKYVKEIKQSDLRRLCRCKYFKTTQDFENTIALLEEYGYINLEPIDSKNNKPSAIVHINPQFYET